MRTLTVTRAMLALMGVAGAALEDPVLTPSATRVLRVLLTEHGFDLARPIRVRKLADNQGFHLEQ